MFAYLSSLYEISAEPSFTTENEEFMDWVFENAVVFYFHDSYAVDLPIESVMIPRKNLLELLEESPGWLTEDLKNALKRDLELVGEVDYLEYTFSKF